MELKKENIVSIVEFNRLDGEVLLNPVFKDENGFPRFVFITKDELQVVRGDEDKMKDLAIKKLNTLVKIGLKANANFLFKHMRGDTLGGFEGGVLYSSILHLDGGQFDKFKSLIRLFGYDDKKSLTKVLDDKDVDFCCYLEKL